MLGEQNMFSLLEANEPTVIIEQAHSLQLPFPLLCSFYFSALPNTLIKLNYVEGRGRVMPGMSFVLNCAWTLFSIIIGGWGSMRASNRGQLQFTTTTFTMVFVVTDTSFYFGELLIVFQQ